MMELKFVSKEGDYIVFESTDGQRMRALLDNDLRDAIRKTSPIENPSFSPKEVQALIRSGLSVDEVASKFSVPASALEPFAAPILDELNFVLQAALSTSVSDGSQMRSFQDLVLEAHPDADFRVRKQEGDWIISTESPKLLEWSFSPKSRTLEPLNEGSRALVKHPSQKREVVSSTIKTSASPNLTAVPESRQGPVEVPVVDSSEHSLETEHSSGASVHDLVEELRARRVSETDVKPQPAKGRASLPSWDEIVLGTSSLDTDSD